MKRKKHKDIIKEIWDATEKTSKNDNPSAIIKDLYFIHKYKRRII